MLRVQDKVNAQFARSKNGAGHNLCLMPTDDDYDHSGAQHVIGRIQLDGEKASKVVACPHSYSLLQTRGRARAKNSNYIVIEVKGSGVTEKQSVNEYRVKLMTDAIARIRALDPAKYRIKVGLLQTGSPTSQ